MLVKQLITKYLEKLKSVNRYSNNTITAYSNDLKVFHEFCENYSRAEIESISERFIKSYLMFLSETGLDKKSIARKLASVRGLFK
ncbi:MAG: site-specific integrase, partial [Ignavibacteriaceae bacterium]|nr:site-specific integrase [Ignavibacteriaceae bacterium]